MSVRLLAYGGTSYGERARVGLWRVDSATLGVREGLQGGESFGLGVCDGQPHAIFRVLQNVETRGGYPFSLLVDPGPLVWRAFEWNAGALAHALKNQNGLFTQPEECTLDLHPLPPPSQRQQVPKSRLKILLVGSAARELSLTVHPRDIGFASRPSAEEMSRVLASHSTLASDPCCCVTGLGWLVGGGGALAQRLGACLAIDDEGSTDTERLTECEEAGRQFLDDWQTIDGWNSSLLTQLRRQPPWEWETSPRDVSRRIGLLAALLRSDTPDSVFADLRTLGDGPLATSMRSVARDLALAGRGAISEERTRFLAEDGVRSSAGLDAASIQRMPLEVLASTLISCCSAPEDIPPSISMPTALVVDIWVRVISEAPEPDRLTLLGRAVRHLSDRTDVPASSYQALVDQAITETIDLKSPQLEQLRSEPRLRAGLRKRLSPRVRRTIKQPDYSRHTEDQFRWLEDDVVVQEVQTAPDPVERATEIVNAWWSTLLSRYPAEAEERFERLATSPLRGLLKNHVKLAVAQATEVVGEHKGPWGNYLYVYGLYNGAAEVVAKRVDEREKPQLRDELQQFLAGDRPATTPNLLALAKLLDPLDQATIEQVRKKSNQPDPLAPGFEEWQKGLKLLNLPDVLADNSFRRWLRQQQTRVDSRQGNASASIRQSQPREPEWLEAKCQSWFFADRLDESDLHDLDNCLRFGALSPEVGLSIQGVLQRASPGELKAFAARFMDPLRLDRLLTLLPDGAFHLELVRTLAMDPVKFYTPYQERMNAALRVERTDGACRLVDKALARYLLDTPEEARQWARTLLGSSAAEFQQRLQRIVALPTAALDAT